jgi:Leucine-rich repeat (LRR) protein
MNTVQGLLRRILMACIVGIPGLIIPISTLANNPVLEETFYNYEEALTRPLEVKTLVFSFNNPDRPYTKTLPDARIKTLVNLERLSIEGYKEERMILPNELKELVNLKDLSIYAQNLRQIPAVVWELDSLYSLYIEINGLPPNALKLAQLKRLRNFSLWLHKTDTLHGERLNAPGLTRLSIRSDDLKYITNHLDQLTGLTSLTLHCSSLTTIPASISSLVNLKRIDIYNKTAVSADIDFAKLDKLEEFRWGHGLFFPISLSAAKNVKRVNFDVSYFEKINAATLPFQRLEQLELSFSQLKAIPKCFGTLHSVKSLLLEYNKFSVIDFDFSQLTNLTFLSFRRCENFDKIDFAKFIKSLKTIKNLKYLETPVLTKQQAAMKKQLNMAIEWREE